MKPLQPSSRASEVRYAIRDIVVYADKLKKEKDIKILPLNIGDPCQFDFSPPVHMIEAVHKAMLDNHNGYSPAYGIPEALEALRREAHKKGLKDVKDIFITTGASEAVELSITALLNPGDNILIPYPQYPLYTAVVKKIGASYKPYYLNEEDNWQPDIDNIVSQIDESTKAIVVINPNNPTGNVYTRETLLRIIELAKQYNLLIISDEIYDKMIFEDMPFYSMASLDGDVPVITFGGIAKNYVVPGWRIGWAYLTGSLDIIKNYKETLGKLLRARLCANHPMQYCIGPALESPGVHISGILAKLKKRKEITCQWIDRIPHLSLVAPEAAFYAFPRINMAIDDTEFAKRLLEQTGVLVVPGSGFGQKPDSAHFRIVFLPQDELLEKAYEKIEEFIKNNY